MADQGVVERDGFELEWVREGAGMPMLVVGAQRYYRRVLPPSMRNHFEMVFFDSRQWTRTPEGFDVESISLQTLSDDTEAVRRATGLDRPVVVGHSHHGTLALSYAGDYPQSLRGLALVAPNPPFDALDGMESPDQFFQRDATPERLAVHERNLSSRPVHAQMQTSAQFVDNYVANEARIWFDPSFDGRPLWEDVEINLEVLSQLYSPSCFIGWQLEATQLPTFLALGRYDYLIPYPLWDEPKKRFGTLVEKLYERSGHTPPYEQPDEFTSDIRAWSTDLP